MITAIGLGFMQSSLLNFGSLSISATKNVSTIAKDFFSHLLHHPSQHMIVVFCFAGIVIAAVVGTLFLIKKIYDMHTEKKATVNANSNP